MVIKLSSTVLRQILLVLFLGCFGFSAVAQEPPVREDLSRTICGNSYASITFDNIPGTTYRWTNDNTSIGLEASGTGNIASRRFVNDSLIPIIANITVTPLLNGLPEEPPFVFTITVTPNLLGLKTDHPYSTILRHNEPHPEIVCTPYNPLETNLPDFEIFWTNNNPEATGLPATGTGLIPPFTAINTGTSNKNAHFYIYTRSNGCEKSSGLGFNFTIKPAPSVNRPEDKIVCGNENVAQIIFQSDRPGTTYSWTNNNTSIGLGASGNGDIGSFIAKNSGTTPQEAIISVTPSWPTETGIPVDFKITVHPIPDVNQPAEQTVLHGKAIAGILFSGNVTGTTYSWTNDNPSIGLAASGNGDIASFIGINEGTAPETATITVTPIANGCTGAPVSFQITVHPMPELLVSSYPQLCNNTPHPGIILSSNIEGATFSWEIEDDTIGLPLSGVGSVPAFTPINTTNTYKRLKFTLNLHYLGERVSSTIISPILEGLYIVDQIEDIVVMDGSNVDLEFLTQAIGFAGNIFTWTNSDNTIGLGAGGNLASQSFTAINNGESIKTAEITVTVAAKQGCPGPPMNFKITVLPKDLVRQPEDLTFTVAEHTGDIVFDPILEGVAYTWDSFRGEGNRLYEIGSDDNGTITKPVIPGFLTRSAYPDKPTRVLVDLVPWIGNHRGNTVPFTITVNPIPNVDPTADLIFCDDSVINEIVFTGTVTGTTFSWTNNNPDTALPSDGNGNMPAFTVRNTGTIPIVSTITVTPIANGVSGIPVDFTITVNPKPTMVKPYDLTLCSGSFQDGIRFSSDIPGTTYTWTNNHPEIIRLVGDGTGDIQVLEAIGGKDKDETATITVIPSVNGCTGAPVIFQVFVRQVPTLTSFSPVTQVVDHLQETTKISFSADLMNATFKWNNNNPSIGLPLNGTGDIPSFTALNTGESTVKATITVTPISVNGCDGAAETVTITVHPTPLNRPDLNQVVCGQAFTAAINFDDLPGISYHWTNSNSSIGLPSSGTGNIAQFQAKNAGFTPVTATITVTPIDNGLSGRSFFFTITVNPEPGGVSSTAPYEMTYNNNESTAVIDYTLTRPTLPGAIVIWNNNNPDIGLPANGTGDIPSFVAVNNGTTPIKVTINATVRNDYCDVGSGLVKYITINPTADVIPPSDEYFCDEEHTAEIIFNSNVAGTTFTWTNDNTSIGLAESGTGNIPSFVAVGAGLSPVTATITVTPRAYGQDGIPVQFTISVLPQMIITPPKPFIVGNNCTLPDIHFESNAPGNLYIWSSDHPEIGLSDNWSNATFIPAFKAINTGTTPITATVTVYPIGTSGGFCNAGPFTFTITVNPDIVLTQPDDQTVFHDGTVTATIFSSNIPGTTYTWTNDNASIGLAAAGNGDIEAFTGINVGAEPVTAAITVFPTANGCSGTPVTFNITVNPIADVIPPADLVLCNEAISTELKFISNVTGTTFSWTNDTPGIGLSANGNGDISPFTAINRGSTPIVAVITVTPKANGADGEPVDFKITVNPTADVIKPEDQVVAHHAATAQVIFSSNVSGTTYSWTNDNASIGLSANGNGDIPSFRTINTGTAPVTATITVTPTANGCTGVSQSFTITVQQIADVIKPADLMVCNEEITTEIKFRGNVVGTTFSWTNSTPGIGLAANGTGDIAAFKANNSGFDPIIATLSVTPMANGAAGLPVDFRITVNPTADVIKPQDQRVAHHTNTAEVKFSSNVIGTTYTWTNDHPSIGLAASGNGGIAAFRAINTGIVPVIATIIVIPTANGCPGNPVSFTITVNPIADVIPPADQTVCNEGMTMEVKFSSNVTGTTFSWTNDHESIGLAAIGNGDIAAFKAINTSHSAIVATIRVIPRANGVDGIPVDFRITVNPTADVIKPQNQTVAHHTSTAGVLFSSNVSGTTYSWTNDNTSIGLAASGNGDISNFRTINTGRAPVTATITVTPTAHGCTGASQSFTITVNQIADVIVPADLIVCNEEITTEVKFSGNVSGTTFSWTNDTPDIGLAAVGSGDIVAFKATNSGAAPLIATIRVTPMANGADGVPVDFRVTVNPTADVIKPTDQVVAHNVTTTEVKFSSNVAGTTYSWTNDNTSIGLSATGNGDIAGFTAYNTGTAPVIATITVTPTANGCTGVPQSFTITVNQIADVIVPADLTVCNEEISTEIKFRSNVTGTIFSWTNNTPGIGLAASGHGDIAAFKATNSGTAPLIATIKVTPRANGADGVPVDFRITVNPTADVIKPQDQTVAHNVTTTEIKFSSNVPGTAYSWTNDNTSIGLSATGNGDIAGFTANNTGRAPVTATITVTPTANGCTGASQSFTITVNQIADVIAPADLILCNEEITTEVKFSSNVSGTTFSWTNNTSGIGLAASGHGDIAAFKAINIGHTPVVATITITPRANGADGVPVDFRITVNPTADVIKPQDQTVAHNVTTTVLKFSSNVSGTTYSWTNDNTSIGLSAKGNGDIAGFTANNTGRAPVTATITVTPTANGCTGVPQSFTITVNQIADVIVPADLTVCNEEISTEIKFSGNVTGTTFSWTNNTPGIGLAASGHGDIAAFKTINIGHTPVVATITITPRANGADGVPVDFRITVNPTADVIKPQDQTVAHNVTTTEIKFSSNVRGTTYSWTNDNTSIGLNANGNGDIASFSAVNTGRAPVTATITVTPTANGCTGVPQSFTITVNQRADVIVPEDLTVCNEKITTEIKFSSNVTGTTFSWTNNAPGIGLAASGHGDIAAFKATNSGTAPLMATIRVTPMANGADGVPVDFRITVNPTADVVKPKDQTVAHNEIIAEIKFSGSVAGTTYSWTNDNTSIGLSANGTGSIAAFRAANVSSVPVTSKITVVPTANGCPGNPVTFVITVNPIPDLILPPDLTVCNEEIIADILFTSNVIGTTYRWTNDNTGIGLAANGSGNINSFKAINTGTTPLTGRITVTPTANGLTGNPVSFFIAVNPTADVILPADQIVCNNEHVSVIAFRSLVAGSTYSWTNNNLAIGLGAAGVGNINGFSATNTGTSPIIATITVIPTANGCVGIPVSFTITVNPTANVIKPSDQTVCNNSTIAAINFQSSVAGTTYTWINDNPAIGLSSSGIGNINSFTAVNTGSSPITARISVIPESNGCLGIPVIFTITVAPLLEVITKELNICGPNGSINLINGLANYDSDLYSYTFYDTEGKELTSSQLISITKAGDYKVKSKDKINGCQSELVTISVGRIALPVVKINHPAATYAPFTIDLTKTEVTAGSDPGLSFHYFLDAAGTQPLLNPEKVGGEAGDYTYYLTGQNAVTGCLSVPLAVKVKILTAPTLSINSAEINEGEEVTLTLQLSNNAVLPENIAINLQGSVIKVPYQIPAQVQLKAGENTATFTVITQKSNVILKDQQVLIITGQQSYYQVNEGGVKINDVLTDDKNNPVVLSISDGRIYEEGDVLLTVSLPGNLITDHDLELSLLNGMGTTLGSSDYSYPANVTIPAGQHDIQFKLTAGNKTGSIQKVVVDGKASALGFDFSVSSGTVTIDGQRLIIGKVISDNGDGINDYFAIENITEYPDNEVVVFNRWGQEVYRAKGYNNDTIRFDSRGNVGSESGRKVPDGTYFYLISINKEGKRTQFKSFIKIKTQ